MGVVVVVREEDRREEEEERRRGGGKCWLVGGCNLLGFVSFSGR